MDTQKMAEALVSKGFTQKQIAEMITARGVPLTQTSVYRILNGADPAYSIGDALRRVYLDHCEGVIAA